MPGQGRNTYAWQKKRLRILKRDGGICRCKHCASSGAVLFASEVDHVIPKSKGGTDDDDNLQAISPECHKRKTAEDEGKARRRAIGADGWPVA